MLNMDPAESSTFLWLCVSVKTTTQIGTDMYWLVSQSCSSYGGTGQLHIMLRDGVAARKP